MFVLAQGGYLYVHGVWPGGPRRPAPSSGRGPRPFYNSGPKPVLTLLSIRAFRLLLCQEIVTNKEHPVLGLFREFEMTVYCFPDPDDPAQVFYMLYINLFCQDGIIQQLGTTSNKISEAYIEMEEWEKLVVGR